MKHTRLNPGFGTSSESTLHKEFFNEAEFDQSNVEASNEEEKEGISYACNKSKIGNLICTVIVFKLSKAEVL